MDLVQPTKKQLEFYQFIVDYKHKNGIKPTYREIANHFGYESPNSVTQNIQALKSKGWIEQKNGEYVFPKEKKSTAYKQGYYDAVMKFELTKNKASEILGISHSNFTNWEFPDSFTVYFLKAFLESTNRYSMKRNLYKHFGL